MKLRAAFVLGLTCLAAAGASQAASAARHQARTPIKHFITILQENHTYDNYFGTYPRGDGFPPNVCVPRWQNSRPHCGNDL